MVGAEENVDLLARLTSENIRQYEHRMALMDVQVTEMTDRIKELEGRIIEFELGCVLEFIAPEHHC
jgi:hypothetical protein